MNYIEILGPAGIGKSTLLRELQTERNGDKWLLLNEGIQKIASEKIKVNKRRRLLQLFLKQSIFTKKQDLIAEFLLSSNQSYYYESRKYEPLMEPLIEYYYNSFEGSNMEKARRICIYKGIIENLCLFDFYKYSGTIIFDEGPLNHHPFNLNINSISQETLPKAVIFCTLDVSENLERIRKREKEGRLAVSHRGLSDPELRKLLSSNFNTYDLKRSKIIEYGKIPFFDINLDNEYSIKELKNFLIKVS